MVQIAKLWREAGPESARERYGRETPRGRQLKRTGLTRSMSGIARLAIMTYGATEHLALETSQAFAPPASHSWKTGFLVRILK